MNLPSDNQHHATPEGVLATLLRTIPGYRGYAARAARRISDERSRAWVATQLSSSKTALDQLGQQWLAAGDLSPLPDLDRLRTKIDLLGNDLRSGAVTQAAFLESLDEGASLLEDVLDHDLRIVEQIDRFTHQLQSAGKAPTSEIAPASEIIVQLRQTLDVLEQLVRERAGLLTAPADS